MARLTPTRTLPLYDASEMETVDHPAHYQVGTVEVIDLIESMSW
jgi:hypothetical protein